MAGMSFSRKSRVKWPKAGQPVRSRSSLAGIVVVAAVILLVVAGVLIYQGFRSQADRKAAEREARIVQALQDFASAQASHHEQHGLYAPHPELLLGIGPVRRQTALAIDPRTPFQGYYFLGLLKQGRGVVDLKKGYALLAVPAKYGRDTRYIYAVGPKKQVTRKDLGDKTPANIDDLDRSWKNVPPPTSPPDKPEAPVH